MNLEKENLFLFRLIPKEFFLGSILLFVTSLILYANTWNHEYALDDQLAIYENSFVKKGFGGIQDLITHDAFVGFFGEHGAKLISGGRYRPFSFITFAIEWEFFGQNPFVGHLINTILYGLLCSLIFIFIYKLFDFKPFKSTNELFFSIPFLGAFLFCIHPIHTEVVANIKGRDEILAMLFGISSFLCFISSIDKPITKRILYLFLSLFFALFSKENAITFLAIFPVILFYKKNNFWDKSYAKLYGAIFLATLIYLYFRFHYTESSVTAESSEILNNPFFYAQGTERWGTTLYSFWLYLKLLLVPHPLTHDYYFNQIPYKSISHPLALAAILAIAGLCFYIFKNRTSKSIVWFGVVFFIATFSIVSNVFFQVGIIMNERFVFVSSLGFSLIIAYFLHQLLSSKYKSISFGILAIYFILLSYKTMARNQDWKNNFTLFEADYKTSNQSAKVATALGGTYLEMGDTTKSNASKDNFYKKGEEILNHSLSIYPENSQTWLLLGNLYFKRDKNNAKAKFYYKKAMEYRSMRFFDANFNLGVIYYNENNMDSAYLFIKAAHDIKPNHAETSDIYSKILIKLGKTQEALAISANTTGGNEMQKTIELAMAAKDAQNFVESLNLAEKVLAQDPQNAEANYLKGISLARGMNKIVEGIPFLEIATKKNKTNPLWNEDLAVAYGMTGQIAKTVPLLEAVIQSKPNDPNPYFNLAASYAKLGNMKKSQEYTQKGNLIKAQK
jgi:tetratricopeptide (TPR) repeat protein